MAVRTNADELYNLGRITDEERVGLNETFTDPGHLVRDRATGKVTVKPIKPRKVTRVAADGTRVTATEAVPETVTFADLYDRWVDDLQAGGASRDEARAVAKRHLGDLLIEARGLTPKQRTGLRRFLGGLLKAWDTASTFNKELKQHNITRIFAGPITDDWGDGAKFLISGQPENFGKQFRYGIRIKIFKHLRSNPQGWHRNLPGYELLDDLGIRPPSAEGVSRYGLERTGWTLLERLERAATQAVFGKPFRTPASWILSSSEWRGLRNAGDMQRRYLAMQSELRREIPNAMGRFQRTMRERGLDVDETMAAIRAQAERQGRINGFDSEDVLRATNNPDLARAWRAEQNTLQKVGNKAHNSRFFDYRQTQADAIISRFFFFHYWMSREVAFHARASLKNPALVAAYWRMWEGLKNDAERNGYPDSLVGLFRYMSSPEGWGAYTDPLSAISPITIFSEWGKEDRSWWERVGPMLNPLVEGAIAAWGGTSNVPDLIGSRAVETRVANVLDWARNNGYDLGMGPGLTSNPVANYTGRVLERINDGLQWLPIPGVHEYEPFNRDAYRRDVALSIVQQKIMDDLGPEWGADHDAAMAEASAAWDSGATDPYLEAAWSDMSNAYVLSDAAGIAGIPTVLRYNPREEDKERATAGYDALAAGQEPTEEMQDAMDRRTLATAADVEFSAALSGYYEIGTPDQQEWADQWQVIVSDDWTAMEDLRIGSMVINGRDLMAMDEDARVELADAWVAFNGGAEDLQAYRDERKAYVAANPMIGDYHEWRNAILGSEMGVRAWRTDAERRYPEFADELAERRERLRADGRTGDVLEKELDDWATSEAAWRAYRGERGDIYEEEPEASVDPTVAPLNPVPSETSGGSGFGKPKGYAEQIREDLALYELKAAQLTPLLGYDAREIDRLAPMIRESLNSRFGRKNIPQLSEIATLYQSWAAFQPVGTDTSPEAFERYMKGLEANASAGLSVFPPQAYEGTGITPPPPRDPYQAWLEEQQTYP